MSDHHRPTAELRFAALEQHLGNPGRDRLVERLSVPSSRLEKLREDVLSLDEADELACAAGYHPSEIWDDWDAALDDALADWDDEP